jgi:hypothetical protein
MQTPHDEQISVEQAAKKYSEYVQDIAERVHPLRVALSGLLLLVLLGGIVSTWYWVIPRDDVSVETLYLQRSGHVVLSEVHNDGSRTITDVSIMVQFIDSQGDMVDMFSVSIGNISSHSSVSGNDMELVMMGVSIWDNHTVRIDLDWTDHSGRAHSKTWVHPVGEWVVEKFVDEP